MNTDWLPDWVAVWNDYFLPVILLVLVGIVLYTVAQNVFGRKSDDPPRTEE
jgi:hypothetical protein